MKCRIRQQKDIHIFLMNEFGKEQGTLLFQKDQKILERLMHETQGKSKAQMKTLIQTILPRVALYKTLIKEKLTKEEAARHMQKYMIKVVAAKKHSSMVKMEKVPFFYYMYRNVFLKIMRTTDLQVSTQKQGKDFYDITITRCLWHTACVENGCEELCSLFCAVDDVTYGGLRKIGFSRTQTLGNGGECCDFHFFRK